MTEEDGSLDAGVEASTPEMLRRGVEGRRIRLLREGLGLDRAGFCARHGFDLEEFASWESGRTLAPAGATERLTAISARSTDAAAGEVGT